MKIMVLNRRMKCLVWLMAALLVIGCVLIWAYYQHGAKVTRVDHTNAMQVAKTLPVEQLAAPPNPDFFTEYRLERDRLRSERSEVLREAIKAAKNDDSRQKAQDGALRLVAEKQRESEMESLIKAKGFADALVVVRDNSVNAVVKTSALTREEAMQVADVISRVSGVKQEDITISAKP